MAKKRGFGSVYQQKRRDAKGNLFTLPTWWIKYSKGGQVFRESSGSHDQREAERLLKKRLGDVVTGRFGGLKPERIKFAELADGVIEDYRENERATVADVERRLKLHLLPEFGEIRAIDFGTRDLKRYIAKRRKEGAENATINRELAIVKRAFRLAAAADPPLVNRVPHISLLEENNVRKGFRSTKFTSHCGTSCRTTSGPFLLSDSTSECESANSKNLSGLRFN